MTKDRLRHGWIGTLLALAMLVVVGFVCGALAGFLWEEPRLVVAYLAGDAETVDWNEPPPSAPPEEPEVPAVAAPPPAPKAPEPPDTVLVRPAAPAQEPAAAPAGHFAIQVGAFAEGRAAEGLAARLRARGYDVYVTPATDAGRSRWRVRVGPLGEREEAERLARRLKRDEKLPTWILDEPGDSR